MYGAQQRPLVHAVPHPPQLLLSTRLPHPPEQHWLPDAHTALPLHEHWLLVHPFDRIDEHWLVHVTV
jgi:hypothetical protein